jgi:hypothetical protein
MMNAGGNGLSYGHSFDARGGGPQGGDYLKRLETYQ